jgi:hypothetical protein
MREKRVDLVSSHGGRVTLSMKENETLRPAQDGCSRKEGRGDEPRFIPARNGRFITSRPFDSLRSPWAGFDGQGSHNA